MRRAVIKVIVACGKDKRMEEDGDGKRGCARILRQLGLNGGMQEAAVGFLSDGNNFVGTGENNLPGEGMDDRIYRQRHP